MEFLTLGGEELGLVGGEGGLGRGETSGLQDAGYTRLQRVLI